MEKSILLGRLATFGFTPMTPDDRLGFEVAGPNTWIAYEGESVVILDIDESYVEVVVDGEMIGNLVLPDLPTAVRAAVAVLAVTPGGIRAIRMALLIFEEETTR